MQFWLEQFGVGVSAISGVLAARGKRVDLFGVIVLALVTALGGGTIRDATLGLTPVFWVKDPSFLYTGLLVAIVAFFIARVHHFEGVTLLVADAFALAMFTMIGANKALNVGVSPPIAVAMGVITGVAGGAIRDVLTGEIPLVFRREIYFYATAALAGVMVFVTLHHFRPALPGKLLAGAAVTLLLRLAAIRWKLSLPIFRDRTERKSNEESLS